MKYFDQKQQRIIKSWHNLSLGTEDNYMAFMSEWIVFNAICYNLYHEKAISEKVNLDNKKSQLENIKRNLQSDASSKEGKATIELKQEKWKIAMNFPERIFLSISRKYTEDIIYDAFVKDYSNWYSEINAKTESLFINLKESLYKEYKLASRSYIINMTRIEEYGIEKDVTEMDTRNIIILCEKNELKTIKKVLYQVRCNIFHGEKIPGDLNDDRIVKCALPMLRLLVEGLSMENNIDFKGQNPI